MRLMILMAWIALVNAKVKRMDCSLIYEFVDAHNDVRKSLAKRELHDKTPAAFMTALVWDNELEQKAENWASKGRKRINPDRTIASGRFEVGENLYLYETMSKLETFLSPRDVVKIWAKQNKLYRYKKYSSNDRGTAAYTQIIWENTTYVGCAIDVRSSSTAFQSLYVCYYGPKGNIPNHYPYEKAKKHKEKTKLYCDLSYNMYGDKCTYKKNN